LLLVEIPGTRRKRVEHRLPHMSPAPIDQCEPASHASERWSEVGGQQQPGDAAADNDDPWGTAWRQLHE